MRRAVDAQAVSDSASGGLGSEGLGSVVVGYTKGGCHPEGASGLVALVVASVVTLEVVLAAMPKESLATDLMMSLKMGVCTSRLRFAIVSILRARLVMGSAMEKMEWIGTSASLGLKSLR